MNITKAIIPVAGLGTRFLPLSKAIPKELLPLVDKPMIQYVVEEAKESGIKEIVFVLRQDNKRILDYLEPDPKIEKFLKERKKESILEEVENLEKVLGSISFSYVLQKAPLGDGHAILQAAKFAKDEPVACCFVDDIFDSNIPVTLQLANVFKTCQKPVIALNFQPNHRLSSYGVAGVEKIASKLHKIKKIVEKPLPEEAPSNLAVVGRYILTPEVFSYLKKAKPSKRGEIILAEVMNDAMIKDGKIIYGCEFLGTWLECGDKEKWLKSNLYFSLKHPKYGPALRDYLKEIK
jgi:UTP--glucose-1-phosphate uridylyltransferase